MIIKRVQTDDRICEFTDIEFSNYETDCNVNLYFEEFWIGERIDVYS